jgi:hypothetical protein
MKDGAASRARSMRRKVDRLKAERAAAAIGIGRVAEFHVGAGHEDILSPAAAT